MGRDAKFIGNTLLFPVFEDLADDLQLAFREAQGSLAAGAIRLRRSPNRFRSNTPSRLPCPRHGSLKATILTRVISRFPRTLGVLAMSSLMAS
jgi:hypothetical protein